VIVAALLATLIETATATSTAEDPMWAFGVMALATLFFNTAVAGYTYGQLRTVSDRFHLRSVRDPLTELANRAALAGYIAEQRDSGLRGTVYVIDIDGFKFVNDSLGHNAGDELLRLLAERLRGHAREGDLLARTGGDEFVLIARGLCGSAQAQSLSSRLLAVCDQPFVLEGLEANVSVTVGAALFNSGGGFEEAMSNADLALYAAKSIQRGTARLFEQSMRKQAVSRLAAEHHLRRALSHEELRLVYQPIVSVPTGGVTAMEALLRWRSEELGDVSPADFIPIAERTALILPIGRFVLREAVRQLAVWREHGHDITLSVNLSAGQLADEQLPEMLAELLTQYGVPPDRVTLELTETTLMERVASQPLEMLERLRAAGVHLALDDFGTGYSSLSRLSRLNLSTVKIDRSFVAEMLTDPPTAAIVSAVLAMAEPLGISVIAEGVETAEQLRRLHELGCEWAQGYLFARPTEADATIALLAREHDLLSDAA
jgi:diguanylate cyclase (GGDEF)-like protein